MEPTFNSRYEQKMFATPERAEESRLVIDILQRIKTIAIVGISKNMHKDSHYVGRYLKNAGYTVVPVNPTAEEILGEKAYKDLKSIPFPIDAVDIFRPPKHIPATVDAALETDAKIIWLQLGTGTHPDEKEKARQRGKVLIQNRCMKVDHQFLIRPLLHKSNNIYA
jgi:uncharacterized protein